MGLDGRFRDMHCDCDFIGLVREDQNERIIKLLEKLDDDPCYVCGDLSKAIELIKGETNE
jgi:hypothetical protein